MRCFRSVCSAAASARASARSRLLPLLFAVALPLAALVAGSARAAVGDPVVFSVFGDMPYRESEIADLEEHVANWSLYSPSAFVVHVGDILSNSESCQETRYQTVSDILKTSEIPVFVLPGDNEWVGCSDPSQGWAWWTEYFLGIEESFCGIWPVDAQSTRPENFAFLRDGVLFIGINYVSGGPSSVTQASADWVNAQFTAHGASVRAAVILAQKEPGGVLFDAVKARGRAFAKPVLYMHGNGHEWLSDPAYFGESNMLRVQVDRGSLSNPPVEVTVTSAGTFLFDRDPWPSGTPVVNRPGCGDGPELTIDDLFVMEGQTATFTVTLANATGASASVGYATQNGSALAGSDYGARSGSLSFSGSTTQRQVQVTTTQDSTVESGESFFVNLTNPSGATLAKAQGTAVIVDDDSPPASGGGPVRHDTVTGGSVGASSVATSGAVAAGTDSLYLAAISFKSNVSVTSVSGLGLGWSPVRQQCGARAQTGIALFQARGSPAAAGVVTANLAASASAAVIAVTRYSGVASTGAIGNVVSSNTLGVSGACSGGTDSTSYAFPLTTGAADSLVFVATGMRSKDHLPGAGYTEIAETYAGDGGSTAGTSVAERLLGAPTSVSVNGSFDGTSDWAVVAAEIRSGGTTATPVTLSVSSSPGGQVALNPTGGSYSVGTTVTLTAIPSAGYAFTGWSGALTGTANPATLLMDASKSVSASFAASTQYSVTVQPTTGGSVTLSPSGGSYAPGTLVTVTAVPAAGYRFGSWSGALSGTANPTTLVVDGNKTLSASFIRRYTLSVATTGSGSVGLSPSGGVYDAGTLVTLSAVPAGGASFLSWSGALSGSANPTTLLMDANKSVTANFSGSAQYSVTIQPTTGGTLTLSPSGGSYAPGTLVTVTAVPASGYRFGSWSGALSGTSNPTTLVVDGNKTISASFIQRFTVSASTTGSGSVALSPSGGVYDVGTQVTLTASPAAGASFLGWSGALSGAANPTTLVVDGNKSVTANFTSAYTLVVATKGKGSVVVSPAAGGYAAGTVVTLTAVPGSGFRFTGWSGAVSGLTNPTTLVMNANKSVTATFKK